MSSIPNSSYQATDVSGGKSRTNSKLSSFSFPPSWFLAVLAIPMLAALGISTYLTYVSSSGGEVAGCSGGEVFDCSHVIYSKWSKLLGIPVSGLALLTYVGMIAATVLVASKRVPDAIRKCSWTTVAGLAIAAASAGIYFIFLQAFVLKHFCPWCLGAHGCGIAIAAAILFLYRRSIPNLKAVSGLAVAGLAVMISLQVVSEERKEYNVITLEPELAVAPSENDSADGTYVIAPIDDDDMMLPPMMDEEEDVSDYEYDDDEAPSEDTDADEDAELDFDSAVEGETAALSYGASAAFFSPTLLMTGMLYDSGADQEASQSEDKNKKRTKKKTRKSRIVKFFGLKLNAYDWPIVGKPSAKHVFVEMYDYTCPHCRLTHRAIAGAKKELGDDLAVVVLAVPMKRSCNATVAQDHAVHLEACELSQLSVAVWRCDRKIFSDFHDWMFEGDTSPTFTEAKAKAESMVGAEKLNKEFNKKAPAAFIKEHVKMYTKINGGVIPKLVFPTNIVQGKFTNTADLVSKIKSETGS